MLKKYECEDVDMLINIVDGIYKETMSLRDLEKSNQSDSQDYKSVFEELKSSMVIRDNILARVATSGEKCHEIVEYLKSKKEYQDSIFSQIEIPVFFLEGNYLTEQDLVFAQIINYLSKIEIEDPKLSFKYVAERLNIPEQVIEKLMDITTHQLSLQLFLSSDIYNVYLALIERMLSNITSEGLRKEIIDRKYETVFLSPLENGGLMENGFVVNVNPYLLSDNIIKAYPKEVGLSNQIKEGYIIHNVKKKIVLLSSFNDYTLTDSKVMSEALLTQILIRSYLVLASKQTLAKIIPIINIIIAELQASESKSIVAQMLMDTLRQLSVDKTIPQIVSFGR